MDTDSPISQNPITEASKTGASGKIYWIAGMVVVLLVAGAIFYINRNTGKNVSEPEKKAQPLFHRDEPTEKQIFQDDYKTKVREMLDSGKSVMEISKETKIRIDEVRRIKKEYRKGKAGN